MSFIVISARASGSLGFGSVTFSTLWTLSFLQVCRENIFSTGSGCPKKSKQQNLLEPQCTHPITSSQQYLLLAKLCTKLAPSHSINRIFRFQHSACYLFWDTMYIEIISFLRFFLSLKMFIFSSFKLRARISKHK